MSTKRFTLMELLVVIVVIAILISMLMPSLSRAKEKARRITCMNNLKQMSMLTMLYSKDSKGYTPPWRPDGNDAWSSGSRNLKQGGYTRTLGHTIDLGYITAAGARGVFYCPSRRPKVRYSVDTNHFGWKNWATNGTTEYSYQHRQKRLISDCSSDDVYGADLAIKDNFTMNGTTYMYTSVGEGITHGGNYYNVQFFDMSVEGIIDKYEELLISSNYFYNNPARVLNKFEDITSN